MQTFWCTEKERMHGGASHLLLIFNLIKKMSTELFIGGQVAVTLDKENKVMNLQFLPDDEMALELEQGSMTRGRLQQLRNGAFDYVANKPRVKAKSTLLRKAAHGRLSATRDQAIQLTLKVFKREGLDVKETLRREALELIDNTKL
jgi:hypothetical protein